MCGFRHHWTVSGSPPHSNPGIILIFLRTNYRGPTNPDFRRVAMVPASGIPLYYAEDMLGSSRVVVQSNGTLCYDADFTPYGAERPYISTCPQNFKFEGKERDPETLNDDFGARKYTWRFGRWLSSDWSAVPVAVPYANLTNPQTLNLYSMVADDPESFADLDGHNGNDAAIQNGTESCSNSNCAGGKANTTVAQQKPTPPAQNKPTIQFPSNESERQLTVVAFNETGGLTPGAKSGNGSADNLQDARVAVAEVAERNIQSGHPEAVASDHGNYSIATGLWQGLHDGNSNSIKAWNNSLSAARTALAGSNTTNGTTHFRLDAKNGRIPKWAKGKTPSQTFGPFRNGGGGDATSRPRIYVYQGVP